MTGSLEIYRIFDQRDAAGWLRGGPVFEFLQANPDWGMTICQSETHGMGVWKAGRPVFADLAVFHGRWDTAEKIAQNAALILDVHFPLTRPEWIGVLQPGQTDKTRNRALDWEAAKRWAAPETEQRALDLVRQATVVTSPWSEWAELLRPYNDNVQVIGDVIDPVSGGRFYGQFMMALSDAYTIKTTGHASKSLSWLRRMAVAFAQRALTRSLRKADIDWDRYQAM